jgi:hypothetical protein
MVYQMLLFIYYLELNSIIYNNAYSKMQLRKEGFESIFHDYDRTL